MSTRLYFLKLGGSLITDKQTPRMVLPDVLRQLAIEIGEALKTNTDLRLLVGHGSGSFGHVSAKKHGTRQGVHTPEQWRGFAEVWKDAATLNHHVMEALQAAGLPAMAFPPSASLISMDGKVAAWDLTPIIAALEAGLIPVVYGDVVFDQTRGGTIFSTEDLFNHLARKLRPQRLLLAGIEAGVWSDYPSCTRLIEQITPETLGEFTPALRGSAATDVTGGMYSKVTEMLSLVEDVPGLEVFILSGSKSGSVRSALSGEKIGTRLTSSF